MFTIKLITRHFPWSQTIPRLTPFKQLSLRQPQLPPIHTLNRGSLISTMAPSTSLQPIEWEGSSVKGVMTPTGPVLKPAVDPAPPTTGSPTLAPSDTTTPATSGTNSPAPKPPKRRVRILMLHGISSSPIFNLSHNTDSPRLHPIRPELCSQDGRSTKEARPALRGPEPGAHLHLPHGAVASPGRRGYTHRPRRHLGMVAPQRCDWGV